MAKKKKRDLDLQYENLVKNGGLSHKPISEREALFLASTYYKVASDELTQGQILSVIRHEAFYTYDKTVAAIRSPERRKEYHKLVNDLIFKSYPWLEQYGHDKDGEGI